MNRRDFVVAGLAGVIGLLERSRMTAQTKAITPDLGALAEAKRLTHVNRAVTSLVDGARRGVRLSAAPGESPAILPGIELGNGTIELDIRGRDVAQQSFVGVAFHVVDGTTYDSIYFRPFNFKAADPVSRGHGVQYVSEPTYTWQKLRTEQPGRFEQAVNPVPDPNGWFRARIVVASPQVRVLIADAKDPCLVVNLLNERRSGHVGLWVGNNSGGDFANLTVTPA
jgi:hypothetical protein